MKGTKVSSADMFPHRYCVVMCGGVGSRFWPISREGMPKQFLDFFGTGTSLLQATVDRIRGLVDPERIIIVTNSAYGHIVREQLPDIKPENILLEPARRNTAPCICWAAHHIKALDPEAAIVTLPSDHLVLRERALVEALEEGFRFVESGDRLLTIGVTPKGVATSYGYIQRGRCIPEYDGICKIKSFTEKPSEEMAKVFLATGEFFWNSGIFMWRADSILRAFEKYDPDTAVVFERGAQFYGTPAEKGFIDANYPATPSISIDYAIMEKSDNVYMLTADLGWSDMRSWKALYDASPHSHEGNVTQNCKAMLRDCRNSVFAVTGDKVVVASGLENYIVADNGNALLIFPIAEERQIRNIVTEIKSRLGEKFV